MQRSAEKLAAEKRAARREAVARRREARAAAGPDAGAALAERVTAAVPMPAGAPVSGYVPVGDEIDVMPVLVELDRRGHPLALPVVAARDAPLQFRAWRPGDALDVGVRGIPVPGAGAPVVVPGLMLVPLLAFDGAGRRLGYGGGYYDRTIAVLRPGGTLAVGVGFAGQEVAALPWGAHDRRLDWIVTERAATRFDCSGDF